MEPSKVLSGSIGRYGRCVRGGNAGSSLALPQGETLFVGLVGRRVWCTSTRCYRRGYVTSTRLCARTIVDIPSFVGCITGIEPHLPILMNFLIGALAHPKPLVRSIACWTIGRYSSWTIKEDATAEHKQQFFVPAMEGVRTASFSVVSLILIGERLLCSF